jgi:hypothetical protein
VVVAATGPSLTRDIASACEGIPVIAVNDAYRLFPSAELLYACDAAWWRQHGGCPEFMGEKWSSHGGADHNDKRTAAREYGLRLVQGRAEPGFSFDPSLIHYGDNSGFQAVNVAGHKIGWRGRIALVGFDMRQVGGRRHFFGDHPRGLTNTTKGYGLWPAKFAAAAKTLPETIEIINCTPGSAITCFPMMELADAVRCAC